MLEVPLYRIAGHVGWFAHILAAKQHLPEYPTPLLKDHYRRSADTIVSLRRALRLRKKQHT